MGLKLIFKKTYLRLRRLVLYLLPIYRKEEKLNAAEIKSILVIRIDRIGDLIVSLPALKALRFAFPLAKISVLVRRSNARLLNIFPGIIDEVISYDGFIKTVRLLRQRQFDLAIDLLMDYPIKAALLASLSKARFTAGFDIADRGIFFNLKLIHSRDKKHVSEYMLDLVKEVKRTQSGEYSINEAFNPLAEIPGFQPEDECVQKNISASGREPRTLVRGVSTIEFSISQEQKERINSILKAQGIQGEDFLIGIHPGGYYVSQRWPVEKFSQLADAIIEKYKVKVVIVGDAKENKLIEKVLGFMKKGAVEFIGLHLDELAALISLMKLFICNNSGPLHIACALNIPTVSTMGPTDPNLWWPQGENHIVLRKDLSCSPCSLGKCKIHDCIDLITVADMMQAVDNQIRRIKKDLS